MVENSLVGNISLIYGYSQAQESFLIPPVEYEVMVVILSCTFSSILDSMCYYVAIFILLVLSLQPLRYNLIAFLQWELTGVSI